MANTKRVKSGEGEQSKRAKPKHPWIQLLDIEMQEPAPAPAKKPGRKPNRFQRKKLAFYLTQNEQIAMDSLLEALNERFSNTIDRGRLFAFLVFRMRDVLTEEGNLQAVKIPDEIKNFSKLSDYLDDLYQKKA